MSFRNTHVQQPCLWQMHASMWLFLASALSGWVQEIHAAMAEMLAQRAGADAEQAPGT